MPTGMASTICEYLTRNGISSSQVVRQSRVVGTSQSTAFVRYTWLHDRGVDSGPPAVSVIVPVPAGQVPQPLPPGSPITLEFVAGRTSYVTESGWLYIGDAVHSFDDARMSRIYRNTPACS